MHSTLLEFKSYFLRERAPLAAKAKLSANFASADLPEIERHGLIEDRFPEFMMLSSNGGDEERFGSELPGLRMNSAG